MLTNLSQKYNRTFIESINKIVKLFDIDKYRNSIHMACPVCHIFMNYTFKVTKEFLQSGESTPMQCDSCGGHIVMTIEAAILPAFPKKEEEVS